jgi:serine protease Do
MSHILRRSLSLLLALLFCSSAVVAAEPKSETLGEQEEAAIRAAVARVADSVVQIRTIGGLEEVDRTLMPDGPTTGLVISADGWILSSAFNFVQQPASILVTLASGEQVPATLVAKDHSRMLVLLKLQGTHNLAVPEFAAAGDVRVGEWAIAVGRTYRADRTSITVGVISAVRRMLGKAIQTDAHVSVANYGGPLVDIYGKVVGIIVPMSPQATSEVAGAEWYDSGIGFAVPLASIEAAIERMKGGADQFPGLLGVSFGRGLAQTSPAEMAAVLPNSPAGMAGLRKGDCIIAIDDQPVASQTDLRFAMSPRYAGESIRVTAKRGERQLERTITLAGTIDPFRHAFLGVLPMRTDLAPDASNHDHVSANAAKSAEGTGDKSEKGDDADAPEKSGPDAAGKDAAKARQAEVIIRMVYPSSPAAETGIRAGDQLVRIDDTDCGSIADAISAMNTYAPGAKIGVRLLRDGKPLDVSATLVAMPTNVPSELPAAYAGAPPSDSKQSQPSDATGAAKLDLRELKLAEFTETCQVYVPPSHDAGRAAGVILWIHAPGEPPTDELFRQWKPICDRDGVIFVAPRATDPSHWERAELEYLRRLIERAVSQYRIDPRRVVVIGQGGGGALASVLALASRDVFTGMAMAAAPMPRTVNVPDNDPSARLAVFAGVPGGEEQAKLMRSGLKKLADAGYPVTAITLENASGGFSLEEREELARWIDALDRF